MKNEILAVTAGISVLVLTLTFFVPISEPEWETSVLNDDHGKFVAVESQGSQTHLFYTNSSDGAVIVESADTSGFTPALKNFVLGKNWQKTWIDNETGVGAYLSATSTDENVFIGYQDDTPGNEKVLMASHADNWNVSTVDSVANSGINVGMHTSITTYNGEPFLIYHSPREGLITAKQTGNDWEVTSRKDGLGRLTSSSSCGNTVKAAYVGRDTDNIRLSEYDGEWSRQNLSEKARSAIALDTRDCRPHMAFLDAEDDVIKYRSPDGEIEGINSSDYTRLGIDTQDEIHLSYQNYGKGLYHAEKTENGWNGTMIDPDSGAGRYNDIEVDEAGNIHIIYSDGDQVKYAVLEKGSTKTVETAYNGLRAILALLVLIPATFLRTEIIEFAKKLVELI